jgi:hypothetical protein
MCKSGPKHGGALGEIISARLMNSPQDVLDKVAAKEFDSLIGLAL